MNKKNHSIGIGPASPILMAACALLFLFAAMTGCKPRTTAEKVQNTVQDAPMR